MKIWIDTKSGTWGSEPEDIVIVDLEEVAKHILQEKNPAKRELRGTIDNLLDSLDNVSDQSIIDFGIQNGIRVTESNR